MIFHYRHVFGNIFDFYSIVQPSNPLSFRRRKNLRRQNPQVNVETFYLLILFIFGPFFIYRIIGY